MLKFGKIENLCSVKCEFSSEILLNVSVFPIRPTIVDISNV